MGLWPGQKEANTEEKSGGGEVLWYILNDGMILNFAISK